MNMLPRSEKAAAWAERHPPAERRAFPTRRIFATNVIHPPTNATS